jgi:2-methylisocitrate lyase-like PEP mutase family enzyme
MNRTAEMRKTFANRVRNGPMVVAPGCYDAFSAKLLEYTGFHAAYMTGAGVSAGLLGVPDLGLLTLNEMVDTAARIVDAISIPLIADADTGYGGPLNIQRTVTAYEKAGVCAIHLEDQEIPKRCGHLEGKLVVSRSRMRDRIRAAVDARKNDNFLLIARTDARAVYGLHEALERGRICLAEGADVVFIEAPESTDEMEEVIRTFPQAPCLINRGGGKKTPPLSVAELSQMGFAVAIFPGDAQKAAGRAMIDTYRMLKETGNTTGASMMTFEERFELLGLSHYQELESRYLQEFEASPESR